MVFSISSCDCAIFFLNIKIMLFMLSWSIPKLHFGIPIGFDLFGVFTKIVSVSDLIGFIHATGGKKAFTIGSVEVVVLFSPGYSDFTRSSDFIFSLGVAIATNEDVSIKFFVDVLV